MSSLHESTSEANSPGFGNRQQDVQRRVGVLSRTLNSSSSIRWILPARIRSPSKNDVVFVGSTFVQLHEFLDTGQLVNTTAKLDFGTQITDAKVISANLKIVPVVDAIFKQERDQEQYTIRGQPLTQTQPPQLLVLATVDNELIYVYATEDIASDVKLVFAKRPLLRGAGLPRSQCRYLAVDYESRALAVASPSGYFGVFKLRPLDDIKAEIDRWDPLSHGSFRPSDEQRFIQVDGDIIMLDFLRSPDSDSTKVLLLILVHAADGSNTTLQYLYRWDTRSPLQTLKAMSCSGRRLKEDQLPLMLIPSTRPYSFVLVLETGISYFENVHSSESKRINCQFVGKAAGPLQWVQWAKPRRHTEYLQKRDDLVIVREDGLLQYFQIEKASSTKFTMNNTIGHLGFDVDTAFCMLAGPPDKGGDIIIAGGSMTDGGVFHVSARGSPQRTQSIENIAPLRDMIVASSPLGRPTGLETHEVSNRLYTCSSRDDGRGELSEIRYGLEAQIGWTMDYPDAAFIDQIWSLEIPDRKELLLLASHTTHTTMVSFELETQDISFTDAETHPGFDFDRPTLAAAVIKNRTIVQVTTGGINVIPTGTTSTAPRPRHVKADLRVAAFFENEATVAIAGKSLSGFEIGLSSIVTSNDGSVRLTAAPSTALAETPTSICCFTVKETRLVLVGTATARFHLYTVWPDRTLKLVFQRQVKDIEGKLENSAVTSLVALCSGERAGALLLCGLRHGILLCLELSLENSRSTGHDSVLASISGADYVEGIRCDDFYLLGSTPVHVFEEKVTSSHVGTSSALVLCQGDMRRVTLHPNSAVMDYTVSGLWVTDRTDPSAEPVVNAFHRVPKLATTVADPGGLLVCATHDVLLFCSLVTQEQGIIRKIPIEGDPRHMQFSPYLNKFVVAFERVYHLHSEGSSDPKRRGGVLTGSILPQKVQQVGIQLIDPVWKDVKTGRTSIIVAEDTSERVNAMINWAPTDGTNHYEWIVLALEHRIPGLPQRSGRVTCLNAKSLSKGSYENIQKLAFRSPDKPVTAICAYKMSSLLIAAGREIHIQNLDFATRKWKTLSKHALPSPAKAISCQGSIIFVATSQHSLFVLVEQDGKLTQHRADTEARCSVDVAAFGGDSAVFSTWNDSGTDLVAFGGFDKSYKDPFPLFHADLPLMVNRIRLDPQASLPTSGRCRFYGSASDGTLFHFTLLSGREWKLLHFLEQMSYMERKTVKPVPIKKRDANNEEIIINPAPTKLKDMHVRGDRLMMMIEPGPYHLQNMLKEPGQREKFGSLVNEVLGEEEHPIEATTVWLRRLLRYPQRS
ncbi:hypothetical protein A1O1_00383 [Capronia coronata CBS 617.96]|uniref:Uncharacterized protein n=1 Tax=Capronia coronata CBS 617.96 TaxID=1182541 RepID=W9YRR4_9EURO|nr:uncharacterized protein A1O1_00383 [Capronia coronata CBS 617.96]EXJ95263.1 hypothetical protein A1O1_00383 [Capronia coronata CBS 617.96]